MIEWGLMTAGSNAWSEKDWDSFLNLANGNETTAYMKDTYKYLRYSCMSRNRDNNGDGKIDRDEVRWYMAASNQLINLFLGSYGIEKSAGLYQRTAEERTTNDVYKWRQHVLASNCLSDDSNSNYDIRVVWAEECLNGSTFGAVDDQSGALVTVRCVRNFGQDTSDATKDPTHNGDVTYSSENAKPDDLILIRQFHEDGREYNGDWSKRTSIVNGKEEGFLDVYLDIDCQRINEKSLRYYTDRELAPHDEFNEAACLYKRFQTTSVKSSNYRLTDLAVDEINDAIDSDGTNVYCPDGYRLPNVREMGIMYAFLTSTASEAFVRSTKDNNNYQSYYTFARTRYSFGSKGLQFAMNPNKWGFGIGKDGKYKALVANEHTVSGNKHKTKSIRCVKDIYVPPTSSTTSP